ncbi:hypothetical protein AOLI_G00240720 [Acnodon oligacanthus]
MAFWGLRVWKVLNTLFCGSRPGHSQDEAVWDTLDTLVQISCLSEEKELVGLWTDFHGQLHNCSWTKDGVASVQS